MSDYPRRETPEGPIRPQAARPAKSAYEDEKEEHKPRVTVPVVVQSGGELHRITGQRIERMTLDIDTAQDYDDRIWHDGPIGQSPSIYDRYRKGGNPASR